MAELFLIPTVLAPGTAAAVLGPQVREVIGRLQHFLVEDVRTARRFISELQTGHKIEALTFHQLHKDTPEGEVQAVLADWQQQGLDGGVLSEAGCPGIADPGAVAVRLAHTLGLGVRPLVGPSAFVLALMGSGLNGQSFVFHGYLPIERPERIRRLRLLESTAHRTRQTQLFMETPYRNQSLLEDLTAQLQPDTLLCVACDLTAPEALLLTRPISYWRRNMLSLHKRPCVFLIGVPG